MMQNLWERCQNILNSKCAIWISLGVLIISFVIFMICYYNVKDNENKAESLESDHKTLQTDVNRTKDSILNKRVAIQKVKENPKRLERQGFKKAKKFINLAYAEQNSTDEEAKDAYNTFLKEDVSKDVLNDKSFKSIFPPEKYKIYPGVTRGEEITIYVESTTDDTAFTNDMTITYDLKEDKLTQITAYRDRGDQ